MSTKLLLICLLYIASLVCSQTPVPTVESSDESSDESAAIIIGIIIAAIIIWLWCYYSCSEWGRSYPSDQANFPEIQAIFGNSTIIDDPRQRSKQASKAWKQYKNSPNWRQDMDRLRQIHQSQLAIQAKHEPKKQSKAAATTEGNKFNKSIISKMKKAEAAEGLPKGWRLGWTADGRVYYLNDITKTTQWDTPQSTMKEPQKESSKLQKLDVEEDEKVASNV